MILNPTLKMLLDRMGENRHEYIQVPCQGHKILTTWTKDVVVGLALVEGCACDDGPEKRARIAETENGWEWYP